jgi:hypothetical protein
MPVSSESCALWRSTASGPRRLSVHPSPAPSAAGTTSCSGTGRSKPPRRRSAPARRADLGQQHDLLARRPLVQRALDRGVVKLGGAAHPRPPQVDGDLLAGRVEVDRPQRRWAQLAGQQAGRSLRQRDRVQGHAGVRPVERGAARPCLAVHGAARDDEGRDVGDGVAHPPAIAVAALEVEGLVEVARAGRVQGDERQVAQVGPLRPAGDVVARPGPRSARRLGEHRLGERHGHLQLGADRGERGASVLERPLGGDGAGRAQAAARAAHGAPNTTA